MSNEKEKDELQNFLRKALEIQLERSDGVLSQEELKAIALRAGLTEDDWIRICSELEAHLTRGRNFLQFKNAGDAVRELDQAVVLAPYRVDVLVNCARAHQLHWEETAAPGSKDRATGLYEKCLRLEPGNVQAAEGLSDLRSRVRHSGTEKSLKRKNLASVMIAALLVTCSGFLAWNGLKADSTGNSPHGNQPLIRLERTESIPDLTKKEFTDWMMTKEFSFTGLLSVTLTFENDHVKWESMGRIWTNRYTVDSPGRVTIHREQDFTMTIFEDLRGGSFESSRGKYILQIKDRD